MTSVAKALQVSDRTLRRWRKTDAFRAALAQAVDELVAEETRRLQGLLPKAIDALTEVLIDAPSAVRLSAARDVLDRTVGKPEPQLKLAQARQSEASDIGGVTVIVKCEDNQAKVRQLHRKGWSVEAIVEETTYSRTFVERVIEEDQAAMSSPDATLPADP